jgi:hypothetical protein
LTRGDDWNLAEHAKLKQIIITTDEAIRLATHGQFQKLVIPMIAADVDLPTNFDQKRFLPERGEQSLALIPQQVTVKFLSAQDLAQFFDRRQRNQDLAAIQRGIESLPWR